MFSDSVLSNLQNCFFLFLFLYTDFFSQACVYAFLSLVILLISAILRAHFLTSSGGFFIYRAFLLSGSVLSSTPYIGLLCLLRMHAINSCVNDA